MGHTAYTWYGGSDDGKVSFSTTATSTPVAPAAPAAPAPAPAPKPAQAAPAKQQAAPKAAKTPAGGPGSGAAAAAAAPAEATVDLLSELDFVVGRITSCSVHPGADSLYVESIDVGTERGGERTIVSGLVKYVPLDQMQGRDVVVVANLKPAALRGVVSNGMVLAAKSADGAKVVLVQPPAGSKPGDRVVPLSVDWSSKPAAKEVNGRKEGSSWALCQPFLRTNDKGQVVFKDNVLGAAGAAATAEISNGIVS